MKNAIVAALLLFAISANAQNFRSADQIYIPSATNIVNDRVNVTNLIITNATGDAVIVSAKFWPVNTFATSDSHFPLPLEFPRRFRLGPRESLPVADVLGKLGVAGQGQLILSGCREGSDCSAAFTTALFYAGLGRNAENPNYRPISVAVQNCSTVFVPMLSPQTHCEAVPSFPWFAYVSSNDRAAGLDHVSIVGIRNDDRYQTKIGFVNASEYASETKIVVTLYNGMGVQVGAPYSVTLGAIGSHNRDVELMFPSLAVSRLNHTSPGTSLWAKVEQFNTVPIRQAYAFGCPDGCPRFFAYADLRDRATGSVMPLGVEFDVPQPMALGPTLGPPPPPSALKVGAPSPLSGAELGAKIRRDTLLFFARRVWADETCRSNPSCESPGYKCPACYPSGPVQEMGTRRDGAAKGKE